MLHLRPDRAGGFVHPSRGPGARHPLPESSRGQALAELALILPILLLLLLGAIDFGRIFYSQMVVNDAAREAALEGSRNPTSFMAGTACTAGNKDGNRIMCRATNEARGGTVTVAPADVTVTCSTGTCPATPALGQTINVRVVGRMTFLTPFIGAIFGRSSLDIAADATAQLAAAPVVTGNAPSASFTVSPSSGTAPLTTTITDTSTGSPVTWAWDFGDGSTANTQGPFSHVYTNPGTYTIRLLVGNASGSTFTTRTVTVGSAAPSAPVAVIAANPTSGAAPLAVTFADASTGSPTSWLWNFGDGTTSTQQNPGVHTFTNIGSITVTLTVTNAGGSSSATKVIQTTQACGAPTASFTVTPGSGAKKVTAFDVTDTSTGMATAGCNAQWSWDFGDGEGSTLQDPPNHVYKLRGTYTIQLTVSNKAGSSSTTRQVTVSN